MAATLQEMLLTPAAHRQVIADCQALVDREIASKSGISATGLKVAYKAIATFTPGYYQGIIETLLPGMTNQLQPFWADFTASGGSEFGDYLAQRPAEVAEALLAVTDEKGRTSGRATVVKTYNAVRGGASKHIEAALPSLGAMIQRYT